MLKSLSILFAFLCSQLFTTLAVALWMNMDNIKGSKDFDLMLTTTVTPWQLAMVQIAFQALLLVYLWSQRLTSEHPFGFFRRGRPRHAYSLLACFLLLSLSLAFALHPLALDDLGTVQHFQRILQSPWGWLLVVCTGPLTEEIVFRDGIQRLLAQSCPKYRTWLPIVGSALCFSMVHLNWAQMLPAFILGIFLGLLYQRTRDLRLCLPAHWLNNLIGAVELYGCSEQQKELSLSAFSQTAIGAIAFLIATVLFSYLYRSSYRILR